MRWSAEFIVGLFVVAAIALFSYFTIRVGQFRWGGEPERWTVRFEDVSGLKEGDPVLALGARVGKVESLQFRTDHILAHLELHEPVPLHEDYRIGIRAPSILASFHVYVEPGSPEKARVTALDGLRGQPPTGLFGDALRDAVDQLAQREGGLGKLLVGEQGYEELQATLRSARSLAERLEQADGALGAMVLGKQGASDLAKTLANARDISTDLAEKDGSLGRLLLADASRQQIEKSLGDLTGFSERINQNGGLGKALLDDDARASLAATLDTAEGLASKLDQADGHLGKMLLGQRPQADLAQSLDSVKTVAADLQRADGALGRLLVGKDSYAALGTALDRAGDAMENVGQVAQKLNTGEGTLARLINDPAAYEDVKKAVAAFRKAAEQVAEGQGTLGKLLTDSSLHDTAQQVLTQVRDAIEDAREQAPVATFTRTLLGGFR
ncbi:MAG: MlaD family protein [Candidatus Brocadiia bacterium]